jgi:hypothetical protein
MHFVETMRGHLTHLGARSDLAFHVRATRQLGAQFELQGVIHAPPWAAETTATGTLQMSALPPRIAYEVRFEATDGRRLRLVGAKHPSLFRPVHSMSWLRVQLVDEANVPLASGSMRFDLLDLPGFLASWGPRPTRAAKALEARRHAVARAKLLGSS